jgi:prophage regulatory protein
MSRKATTATRPDIVGVAEIQNLILDRDLVEQITSCQDFPSPVAELKNGAVWVKTEVQDWIKVHPDVLAELLTDRR